MKTTQHKAPAVLALIALLFNVFLPFFVAPAEGAARAGSGVEAQMIPVCTAHGLQWLPVDGQPDGDGPQRPLGPECCILCPHLLHAKLIAPASVPAPVEPAASLPVVYDAHRPSFDKPETAPQSRFARAPPYAA